MIKQSGDLINYPFWDQGRTKRLIGGVIFIIFMLILLGLEYFLAGRMANLAIFSLLLLAAVFLTYIESVSAFRQVWIDLHNGVIVIGSRSKATKDFAAEFESLHSHLDSRMGRDGYRHVNWLSVFLHGPKGDLEIARFSDSKMAINGWSDHAEAQALRELLSVRFRLKDYGVLGETLPQLIAKDEVASAQFLSSKIAPSSVGIWIRRLLKLGVLILGSPIAIVIWLSIERGQALTLSDFSMIASMAAILSAAWIGLDLIERRDLDTKRLMSRAAFMAGVFSCLFAVPTFISALSDGYWRAFIVFSTLGASGLAYWFQTNHSMFTRTGSRVKN